MAVHTIRRGLKLPISGAPEAKVHDAPSVSRVALVADDYPYMKPRMHVAVGDVVKRGQLLFEDRKVEGVNFTALGAGKVIEINRGARRAFQSLVIELTDTNPNHDVHVDFKAYTGKPVDSLDGQAVRDLLSESGLWTAIRTRPHDRVPAPTESCASIFVTALNSDPLGCPVDLALDGKVAVFTAGLKVIGKLTDGPVWLCKRPGSAIDTGGAPNVKVEEFEGQHPAGLVGTHIHRLDPVHAEKIVWHLHAQDVVAIGELFATGKLSVERTIALGGPGVKQPRLLKTRMGACLKTVTDGQLKDGEQRVVSGSVLAGRNATGPFGYLGRFHTAVAALQEGRDREFLGWLMPGGHKFSGTRAFLGSLMGGKTFEFTTTVNGSHRAMVPLNMFERVCPPELDFMPTFLLRALVMDDETRAEALGCLELGEEDLGMYSFLSPGKEDFGAHLRRNLLSIWKEG